MRAGEDKPDLDLARNKPQNLMNRFYTNTCFLHTHALERKSVLLTCDLLLQGLGCNIMCPR